MSMYEVLASECAKFPDCAKVAVRVDGRVAIVGDAITDPAALAELGVAPHEAALDITEELYRAGYQRLVEHKA